MWLSVIDTPAQHLRSLFIPFPMAIRHSWGEQYWYLANQKQSVFSSDVTSLPCRAVEVARELPVHLLPNTAERNNEGRMQDETDLVSGISHADQYLNIFMDYNTEKAFQLFLYFWITSYPKNKKQNKKKICHLVHFNCRLDERERPRQRVNQLPRCTHGPFGQPMRSAAAYKLHANLLLDLKCTLGCGLLYQCNLYS